MELELTINESEELEKCEATIEHGLNTFVDVGTALLKIRDERLYRQFHSTFEDYCRERWGIAHSRANQLMDAAQIMGNLKTSTIVEVLPANEAQVRPLASLPPEQQREIWAKAIETPPGGKITAAHVQSIVDKINPRNYHVSDDSYEWYTPQEYIEAARTVMGSIDLDPASCAEAQNIVSAQKFYSKDDDGLSQDWAGSVWLNPPYCMPDIENFALKTIAEFEAGNISQAIVLTNNATDTAWFHSLMNSASLACLTKGRVKFWGPDGESSAGPRQGQVLFYLGENEEAFIKSFSKFGIIVKVV